MELNKIDFAEISYSQHYNKDKMSKKMIENQKQQLMELLGKSSEEMEEYFKGTMYSFKYQIEKMGGDNLFKSIMDLDYVDLVEYIKEKDNVEDIVEGNDLNEDLCVNKSKGEKKFMCLCGKAHLKNLHIFRHKNEDKQFVIGSSCINQVEKLKDLYSGNLELKEKLEFIVGQLKQSEKKLTHNKCQKCGDFEVSRKEKKSYKNEKCEKLYCKSCLSITKYKNKIKCQSCYISIWAGAKSSPYQKEYNKECPKCWHKSNKNEEWYKRKYPVATNTQIY
tara:strand:- start:11933 stop:12763 length:831 start_codon:yes stop_codon:yes gene_type:complete